MDEFSFTNLFVRIKKIGFQKEIEKDTNDCVFFYYWLYQE